MLVVASPQQIKTLVRVPLAQQVRLRGGRSG
jgi:hypothetical protein